MNNLGIAITAGIFWAALSLPSWGLDPASPTSAWAIIQYGASASHDPSVDQQTGSQESDIVGNAANPSLYKLFEGSPLPASSWNLAFRVRVGEDKNPTGFTGAFFVGLDGNNDGALDLFIGVENSGAANQIGIWNPGTGANISPSTTTISSTPIFSYTETAANYSWAAVTAIIDPTVTNTDLDAGGKVDQFLSFVVPFADLQAQMVLRGIAGFNEKTPMSMVAATATQANSLNQDLNGVAGGVNSSSTWSQLGATSSTYTAEAVAPVPEPCGIILVPLALVAFRFQRRR